MDAIIAKHKKGKQKRNYFTSETEDAIIKYNNTDDPEVRSDIYQTHIHYPFYKLTENIIHTFKFYNTDVENLEDLQHEIITFLLDKLHLFDPSRGAKAYSYFGTIVKNYLIVYNDKNYKKTINSLSINSIVNDVPTFSDDNEVIYINHYEDKVAYNEDFDWNNSELIDPKERLAYFVDRWVQYCSENLGNIFSKERDIKVADCVLELFRKRDDISIFNKKALYIYIREMIDVKTTHITKVSKILGGVFKEKYKYFNEYGKFPS